MCKPGTSTTKPVSRTRDEFLRADQSEEVVRATRKRYVCCRINVNTALAGRVREETGFYVRKRVTGR